MKLFNRKFILAVAFTSGIIMSCTDNFEELNTNPSQPALSNTPANILFASGVRQSIGGRFLNSRSNLNTTSVFAQHMTNSGFTGNEIYAGEGDDKALWDETYLFALPDINAVIEKTTAPEDVNRNSLARIWRAWILHRLTDYYGDIPYSEAAKGLEGNLIPVYDTQQSIYTDLLKELQEAEAAIDLGLPSFTSSDIIFEGDLVKWQAFANSLRLRLALRVSNVDAALAQTNAEDAIARGVMQSNADIVMLITEASGAPILAGSRNGIGEVIRDEEGGILDQPIKVSKRLADTLINYNDPRLPVFVAENDGGDRVGIQNGLSIDDVQAIFDAGLSIQDDFSTLGAAVASHNSPFYLFTYAETEFLLAEAALNGWAGAGTPASHYEAGIRASLAQFGVDSGADAYLAGASVAYDAANAMEQIQMQKYIAIFTDGFEAWANVRRTGIPNIGPISSTLGSLTNGEMPRRVRYPITEQTQNEVNYRDAAARYTDGDTYTSRVWWDN